jgi:hypothetical protein
MKAALSIGANSPGALQIGGDHRGEIWAPMFIVGMKSVIAIGSGSTLARLMSISTTARAGLEARAAPVLQPSARGKRINGSSFSWCSLSAPFQALSSTSGWDRSFPLPRSHSAHESYFSFGNW